MSTQSVKGVILVGGPSVGTRFRPLSLNLPKPLFPIAGYPMIHHHIGAMAKIENLREILLIGYFDNGVFDGFVKDAQTQFSHLRIRYLREYQALGTGGGLYHFRDEIMAGNPSYFFVTHADICSSFPLSEMVNFHLQHEGTVTILATTVSRDEAQKYGCLVRKEDTSEVLHYVEKPETFVSASISCGIYLFNTSIFENMKNAVDSRRFCPIPGEEEDSNFIAPVMPSTPSERVRLEQDVLRPLAGTGKLFAYICHPPKDFWMQIKSPSSAIAANRLYLNHIHKNNKSNLPVSNIPMEGGEIVQPVWIHPSAVINAYTKIGPNVFIGPRTVIGRGVRIKDSILLDNVEVGNDSVILQAIIGWDSKIGSWARVEGSLHDGGSDATAKGLKVPSATILGKDVKVADEIAIRNCIVLPNKELKNSYHNEILM